MNLEERSKILQVKGACFNCLKTGHMSWNCPSDWRCKNCGGLHHKILCRQSSEKPKDSEVKITNTGLATSTETYLKTIMINVLASNGKQVKVRVLIDDGAQLSYISQDLIEELGLKSIGEVSLQHSLFGGVLTETQHHKKYELKMRYAREEKCMNFQLLDKKKLCGRIERLAVGPLMHELKRKKIFINDIGPGCPEINILIGANYSGKILVGRAVQMENGMTAVNSIFGWVLFGEPDSPSLESCAHLVTSSLLVQDISIEHLWQLEAIGIKDSVERKSQDDVRI